MLSFFEVAFLRCFVLWSFQDLTILKSKNKKCGGSNSGRGTSIHRLKRGARTTAARSTRKARAAAAVATSRRGTSHRFGYWKLKRRSDDTITEPPLPQVNSKLVIGRRFVPPPRSANGPFIPFRGSLKRCGHHKGSINPAVGTDARVTLARGLLLPRFTRTFAL